MRSYRNMLLAIFSRYGWTSDKCALLSPHLSREFDRVTCTPLCSERDCQYRSGSKCTNLQSGRVGMCKCWYCLTALLSSYHNCRFRSTFLLRRRWTLQFRSRTCEICAVLRIGKALIQRKMRMQIQFRNRVYSGVK